MVTWTDWWLAGHFFQHAGDATKAAMNLMGYTMWLVPSMFAAIAIGATAVIARSVGSQQMDYASRTANQAYGLGAVLAIVMTTLVVVFGNEFVDAMRLTGDAAEYAREYLYIIVWVIPLIMFTQVGAACLRGAGDTVTGFYAKLVVVIVNIIVSVTLVTGWGPFPQVGWKGLAIGTAIGHALGGIIVLVVLIRGRAGLKLQWNKMKPDFDIVAKLAKIGLPGGFDIATLLGCQLVFLAMINSLGKSAAAAHGLTVQIEASAFLPGAAFQIAAATMTGQFLGAKMPERAKQSALLCTACAMAIMVVSGAAFYLGGHWFAVFFTGDMQDPTTFRVAELLKIVAISMPSLAIVMVLTGALRGAGDTVWPLVFTAVGFLVIRIPLAAYFAFETFQIPVIGFEVHGLGLGVHGAWIALVVDLLIRSLMVGGRFYQGGWRE